MNMLEQQLIQKSNELNELKLKSNELEENNSLLESKLKELEALLNSKQNNINIINNNLGNNNINKLSGEIEDNLQISTLSVDDLKMKVASMKEVNDLLYKQLEESDKQKLEFENKLIKLQTAFNDQLEEEKREIMRLYKNKKTKESKEISFVSGDDAKNIVANLDDAGDKGKNKNESNEKLKNKLSLLQNENISLKEVVKDLKKEIIDLKNANSLQNKGYNLIGTNMSIKKVDENNEQIVEELMLECNKWKKQYSLMYNENGVLKKYISKLEKNLGIEEQMNNLRNLVSEKDQVLMNLSYQIKEYQSKVDDIILAKSKEGKDKQIQMLLNEVKGIRKRILNIITLNDRITNFDEFMEAIKTIKQLENTNKDKNIEKAFDQLNYLIEIYQQNDDNAYSQFVNEIYGEGKNVNNLIDFEEFGNDNQNNNDNHNGGNINNINNAYDNIDLDNNNIENKNNFEYNENGSKSINKNEQNNIDEEDDLNENNQNNIKNNEEYFDTNMNQNNENENDMNFNTNEQNSENDIDNENNEQNNNYNENNNFNGNQNNEEENNNYNEDNNFGNAFDDINFEEFENDENNPEQNKENNNNSGNNQNNNNENGDDDIL